MEQTETETALRETRINTAKTNAQDRRAGALLMILSTVSFSMMSVMVKLSAAEIGTMEQVFFRNLVSVFIAGSILYRKKLPLFGDKKDQPALCARSFFGFVGVIMLFYAAANARQADVAVLSRTAPVWTTVFSVLFLKEKLSKVQIPVIILCLAGAVIAMRPALDSNPLPLFLAAMTAVTSGLAYNMIALCKGKVDALTVIFHFSFFSTVCALFMMLPTFSVPTPKELAALILIGVFAAGGQIGLTYAYQKAPAAEVSIYDYIGIVASMILGFVFFGEALSLTSVLGGVLITGAALWSYLYNHKRA